MNAERRTTDAKQKLDASITAEAAKRKGPPKLDADRLRA